MPARSGAAAATVLLLLLGACSTPRDRCIGAAKDRYESVAFVISELRQTIARGYALHRERVPYTIHETCYRTESYTGDTVPYSCPSTAYRTTTTPVAVDIGEERRKLADYEKLLPKLRAEAAAGVAQCDQRFPVEG